MKDVKKMTILTLSSNLAVQGLRYILKTLQSNLIALSTWLAEVGVDMKRNAKLAGSKQDDATTQATTTNSCDAAAVSQACDCTHSPGTFF
ncbi:hypothetical protein DSO57_1021392 [Entomophthora muscae]|uniref:Uncharacterized protein n=1 Tax=Entomophthora muscae TaxID=34485 RepID=A0ACC2S5B6_9FUNG|nr:hypothetical protein DSO57_1021392 [Entomophthora muscae]